jgi:hypothetical protein
MNCAAAMDAPPATSIMNDLTFPYANTATLKTLSSTWADFFTGIGPAICGDVYCRLRRDNTNCDWSYLGTHISPSSTQTNALVIEAQ